MSWMMEIYGSSLHGYKITRVVYSGETPFQQVEIVETVDFGRVLLLDGVPQSSAADEFIYHEVMVHPAMLAHPAPRRVLVVGGGEGAILREVLKHNTVEAVTMVDLDEALIRLTREHLPGWHQGAFDDERVTLVFGDGRAFIEEADPGTYDVILLDLVDLFEDSPARLLYTVEFYAAVQRALTGVGVMALQAMVAGLNHDAGHLRVVRTLREAFPVVRPYYAHIPVYTALNGFALCTPSAPDFADVQARLAARGVRDLRYISGETLPALFAMPPYLRQRLDDPALLPLRDEP